MFNIQTISCNRLYCNKTYNNWRCFIIYIFLQRYYIHIIFEEPMSSFFLNVSLHNPILFFVTTQEFRPLSVFIFAPDFGLDMLCLLRVMTSQIFFCSIKFIVQLLFLLYKSKAHFAIKTLRSMHLFCLYNYRNQMLIEWQSWRHTECNSSLSFNVQYA